MCVWGGGGGVERRRNGHKRGKERKEDVRVRKR